MVWSICRWKLALIVVLSLTGPVPAQQPGPQPPEQLPITGKTGPLGASLDDAMFKTLMRHGIPGGALAVTREGRLVMARGYGWANIDHDDPVKPETLFPLASVSKVLTTLAIFKLVEAKKLTLEDKPFVILKDVKAPTGATVDPRLYKITIRQLLNHSGGWNRNVTGDPINWSRQIARRLQVKRPINDMQLISYMLGQPLDFEPGTDSQYSNVGFIVLGPVIAKVSGQPYEDYVRKTILDPLGMKKTRLLDPEGNYAADQARRYLAGTDQLLPAYTMPWTKASGCWESSVVELAKLITAIEGSRGKKPLLSEESMDQMLAPPPLPIRPRPDGTYQGLGWDVVQKFSNGFGYAKGGSWTGIRSTLKRGADGTCSIVLFNASIEFDVLDQQVRQDAVREILDQAARIKTWPKVDFFNEFP
jgi:N-acyl-D-amino-acid deacylase